MERQIERSPLPATTKVYDAALEGDIPSLLKLLKQDPLILHRCIIENSGPIMQSPLHVAANMGHSEFTVEILNRMPELAEVVDPTSRCSPLHVASAKGHLEIVKSLVVVNPRMCLAQDQDGQTPIHVASARGQVNVLEVLHHANRYAAQERTNNGETILHLCVKNSRLEALKTLLRLTDDDGDQLINSKDNSGNTVLHLAVTSKQPQMVKYLVRRPKIEKNAMNKSEMTAVDIYLNQDYKGCCDDGKMIKQSLKHVRAKPAKEALSNAADNTWIENQRSALMVVASLIATMAFQAGINPPGGVWQNDDNAKHPTHVPGTAVWPFYNVRTYRIALISNTIGLVSSLSVIVLLISGLPFKRYILPTLRVTLWIAVTATSLSYLFAIGYVTGSSDINSFYGAVIISLLAWIGLVAIVFSGHAFRFTLKLLGWQRRQSIKEHCQNFWFTMKNNNGVRRRLDLDQGP